jgi:phosphoglycolate phosphatase-like HAD superfamily hydrolase
MGADRSVVLLDLDSTLYEVGPRTHRIIMEWVDGASSHFTDVASVLKNLKLHQVGYSIRDIFQALGIFESEQSAHPDVQAAFAELKDFWAKRFFTTAYLGYDRAYPQAAEFVRDLHEKGAEIVYLTGRDEPFMGDGTRANLLRDGFPWELPRTHLLMKPSPTDPDLDHKKNAANYIRNNGELIASFENEPANLVALYDLFPQAMHVFVDTVCSDHEAPGREGLYRIKGFEKG